MELFKTNFCKGKYDVDQIEVLLGEFRKCIGDERWENFPTKGKSMPAIQKNLINIVLLAYMTFINVEALEFLSQDGRYDISSCIEYIVSVEKMLFDNIIGSQNILQEIIHTSGLLMRSDVTIKLKVTTQGDELLPVIQ